MIGMSSSKKVPSMFTDNEGPELPSEIGNPVSEITALLRAVGTSDEEISRLLGVIKCDLEGWFSILELMKAVCDGEVFGDVYSPLGRPPF